MSNSAGQFQTAAAKISFVVMLIGCQGWPSTVCISAKPSQSKATSVSANNTNFSTLNVSHDPCADHGDSKITVLMGGAK